MDAAERITNELWDKSYLSDFGSHDANITMRDMVAAIIRAEYQELVDAAEYATENHCDSLHMKLRAALRKVKP